MAQRMKAITLSEVDPFENTVAPCHKRHRKLHFLKPEADAAPQKPGLPRPSHQTTG